MSKQRYEAKSNLGKNSMVVFWSIDNQVFWSLPMEESGMQVYLENPNKRKKRIGLKFSELKSYVHNVR